MAQNFLQLNEAKTECLVFGSIKTPTHILDCLGPLASHVHKQANYLGVIFVLQLKFDKHVHSMVKAGFRVQFKVLTFVFKALHGLAPKYIF